MGRTINSTPKSDGFRMPGEFEEHAGTWMLWPMRTDTWRSGAKPAQKTFAQVAKAISQFEQVTVCVNREQYENARAMLDNDIRVVEVSSNDSWMRDIGPSFVINDKGDVRGVDWRFNAWGGLDEGLYFPWDQDQLVKQKVMEIENIDRYNAKHFVLEGGAIHVDGEGTVITTEQCVLNANRNGDMPKEEVEKNLKDYLNAEKVIWVKDGLVGDETDGHVDEILFYVRPGEIALGWTEDPEHPHYEVLHKAYDQLKDEKDAKGRTLKIHKIPMPKQVSITAEESAEIDFSTEAFDRSGDTSFIATYINCYLCNGGLVLPAFGDPADEEAVRIFQEIYPDRKIVSVETREVSLGGGNIHCITQQQPKG